MSGVGKLDREDFVGELTEVLVGHGDSALAASVNDVDHVLCCEWGDFPLVFECGDFDAPISLGELECHRGSFVLIVLSVLGDRVCVWVKSVNRWQVFSRRKRFGAVIHTSGFDR